MPEMLKAAASEGGRPAQMPELQQAAAASTKGKRDSYYQQNRKDDE